MIGKIISGSSFSGTVGYVMKEKSRILEAEGIVPPDAKRMAEDFNDQTLLNPRLKNTVGHISLSFSPKDAPRMTDALMTQIAKEYMQKMGITDTQYLLVRHLDQPHPHCHLVYNRVGNDGQTISDKNIKIRNAKVCRELTEKYGLYLAPGKDDVRRERLREPDKTRYEIYDAIKRCLPRCAGWKGLEKQLEKQGIGVRYKYCGNTDRKQGVLFSKNGFEFSGSKIDRAFSFTKLDRHFTCLQQQTLHWAALLGNLSVRRLQRCSAAWAAVRAKSLLHPVPAGSSTLFRCRRPVRPAGCRPNSCSASREKVPKSISHASRHCSTLRPRRWL